MRKAAAVTLWLVFNFGLFLAVIQIAYPMSYRFAFLGNAAIPLFAVLLTMLSFLGYALLTRILGLEGIWLAKKWVLVLLAFWALDFGVFWSARAMFRKSNESATRGNLGSIRAALNLYTGDMNGQYPRDLDTLTIGGKYLPDFPKAKTYYHPESSAIHTGTSADDAGGWFYAVSGPSSGAVKVNCTHTDTRGTVWTAY